MSNMSLQEKVEFFVKSRKVLKKDFATKIGITPVMLSHWLKGRVLLNIKTLEKITTEIDK